MATSTGYMLEKHIKKMSHDVRQVMHERILQRFKPRKEDYHVSHFARAVKLRRIERA